MPQSPAPEGDLYFAQIPVGEMQNFAYLIGSRESRECLVVDPAWAVDALCNRAEADGMRVTGALVTHYHQDHVGGELFGMNIQGLARLLERNPCKIHVNKYEAPGLMKVTGVSAADLTQHEGGAELQLGRIRIRLLHTPGHTPGSQCFLVEEGGAAGRLVSGDTLFLGSCGRVDLPGSNPEHMFHSLRGLAKLPDQTVLFPGHFYAAEPFGEMAEQKRRNPMLRFEKLEDFLSMMGR